MILARKVSRCYKIKYQGPNVDESVKGSLAGPPGEVALMFEFE